MKKYLILNVSQEILKSDAYKQIFRQNDEYLITKHKNLEELKSYIQKEIEVFSQYDFVSKTVLFDYQILLGNIEKENYKEVQKEALKIILKDCLLV